MTTWPWRWGTTTTSSSAASLLKMARDRSMSMSFSKVRGWLRLHKVSWNCAGRLKGLRRAQVREVHRATLRQTAEAHSGFICPHLFNLGRRHEDPVSQRLAADGAALQRERHVQGLGPFQAIGGARQYLGGEDRDMLVAPCNAMQDSSQLDGKQSMEPNKLDACSRWSQCNAWLRWRSHVMWACLDL